MSVTEPLYPQDLADEEFCAEQQRAADLAYRDYLERRGITEEEHLIEIYEWCDAQD